MRSHSHKSKTSRPLHAHNSASMGVALKPDEKSAAERRQAGVVVVGLGKTGLSCARYLAARRQAFAIVDSRSEPPCLEALRHELPEVTPVLGTFDERMFAGADEIVLSPGVSLREPSVVEAIERGVRIIGDVELFAREARAPVIAITGSNGKTTVTGLLAEMARVAGRDVRVGGNIGTPALELLNEPVPEFYILELSSFQLQTTHSLRPAAAVILNISADHFDRHGDMEQYLWAKQRIYRGEGVMIMNRDDERLCALIDAERKTLSFGINAPAGDDYGVLYKDGEPWLAKGGEYLIAAREMLLKGMHNIANALAALALGESMGLPMQARLAALRHFKGLPHRMQIVAEQHGVQWINDSKATNVGAASAAIQGLAIAGKVVLIAGGVGKGADFSVLRPVVKDKVRTVILLGEDARLIEEAIGDAAPTIRVGDMHEAVKQARDLAQSGDVILLSPACASFDMYSNYEQRGYDFISSVIRLLG